MAVAENKKRVVISLTVDQTKKLEELAKKRGFSKSAIIALALEEYSRRENEQKK